MSPQLSLVTGYRNRDLPRVKRFLDSLRNQVFQDFELILVDYGSEASISASVSELCTDYPFCVYLFCDTRGKVWNRAHALNIGIQNAKGQYFLSADVDVIYSQNVLTHLISICNRQSQIFCKAFLLPKAFSDFTQLSLLPVKFSLTKPSTLGLFHCVHLDWVRKIGGYDEYYKIWGFEDTDFARRLAASGLTYVWLEEQINPIYHQWHPAGLKQVFMKWWWEDMIVYETLSKKHVIRQQRWGEFFTQEKRPLNRALEAVEYVCPKGMDPFERRKCIGEIMHLLQCNPNKLISVELYKEPERMYVQQNLPSSTIANISTVVNKSLRFFGSKIHLKVSDPKLHRSESSMLYFFYGMIMKSDLLLDYGIHEFQDKYRFTLLLKPG